MNWLDILNSVSGSGTVRRELQRIYRDYPGLKVPRKVGQSFPYFVWEDSGDTLALDYLDFPEFRTSEEFWLSEGEFVFRNSQ